MAVDERPQSVIPGGFERLIHNVVGRFFGFHSIQDMILQPVGIIEGNFQSYRDIHFVFFQNISVLLGICSQSIINNSRIDRENIASSDDLIVPVPGTDVDTKMFKILGIFGLLKLTSLNSNRRMVACFETQVSVSLPYPPVKIVSRGYIRYDYLVREYLSDNIVSDPERRLSLRGFFFQGIPSLGPVSQRVEKSGCCRVFLKIVLVNLHLC